MKTIRTTYHGPTNTRGARITATDEDGNRVSISYPHEISGVEECHREAAKALYKKMGWNGAETLCGASFFNQFYWLPMAAHEPAPKAGAAAHIITLADYLEEAHGPEMDEAHEGDSDQPGPDPDGCSYCAAIRDAREFLNR